LKALAENDHEFSNLKTIDFGENKRINDEGLIAMAYNGHKFSSLLTIDLWGNEIGD
jgi:hypothetical protein